MAASLRFEDPMTGINKAVPRGNLSDLCAALGNVEELAEQIISMKRETRQKDAEILAEILERVTPLVAIIGRQGESYYRRDIIILSEKEAAPLTVAGRTRFYSEHQLVLYENGMLYRLHRFGETSGRDEPRPGWEMNEEYELSAEGAVAAFGLQAIVAGLVDVLQKAKGVIILKDELEGKLAALCTVLDALA